MAVFFQKTGDGTFTEISTGAALSGQELLDRLPENTILKVISGELEEQDPDDYYDMLEAK